MSNFLDNVPFDWSIPESQQLRGILAKIYSTDRKARNLLRRSKNLKLKDLYIEINFALASLDFWTDIIDEASNSEMLRSLVEEVQEDDAAKAYRDVIAEFLTEVPVAPSPGLGPVELIGKVEGDVTHSESVFVTSPLPGCSYDVAFFNLALKSAASVARMRISFSHGDFHCTAFHIGQDLLLTTNHVLIQSDELTSQVRVLFDFEYDLNGLLKEPVAFDANVESIIRDSKQDWGVIKTFKSIPERIPALRLGINSLLQRGAPLYIIEHSLGGPKRIVLGVFANMDEDVFRYVAEGSRSGTSGAPVFDGSGNVVGISQARLANGTRQGVRIERVLEGLEAAGIRLE